MRPVNELATLYETAKHFHGQADGVFFIEQTEHKDTKTPRKFCLSRVWTPEKHIVDAMRFACPNSEP